MHQGVCPRGTSGESAPGGLSPPGISPGYGSARFAEQTSALDDDTRSVESSALGELREGDFSERPKSTLSTLL